MVEFGSPRWPARPSRGVAAYYALVASRRARFTVPVFVLFFQHRGLSLAEVGLVEAAYTLAVLGFETPTGVVADRLGRRRTLLAATALGAVGLAGFALAHSLAAFLAVVVLRALSGALASGTAGAWLYDHLAGRGDEAAYARVEGRAGAVGKVVAGAAAVLGGVLYDASRVAPWLAEAGVVALGLVAVFALPAGPGDAPDRGGDAPDPDAEGSGPATGDPDLEDDPTTREVLAAARRALARRDLRWFVGYTGLAFGVLAALAILVQPVATTVAGVDPRHLGALYAGFTLAGAAGAALAGRVHDRVGVRRWFAVAPPALGAPLALVAALPALALPVFFLDSVFGAVSRPLAGQYLNDRTATAGRATTLSAASMVRSLLVAPLKVAGGALAGALALAHAMGALGVLLVVGAVVSLPFWLPASGPDGTRPTAE